MMILIQYCTVLYFFLLLLLVNSSELVPVVLYPDLLHRFYQINW